MISLALNIGTHRNKGLEISGLFEKLQVASKELHICILFPFIIFGHFISRNVEHQTRVPATCLLPIPEEQYA